MEEEKPKDPYGRGEKHDDFPKCWRCERILAEYLTRPWKLNCQRCKATNKSQ